MFGFYDVMNIIEGLLWRLLILCFSRWWNSHNMIKAFDKKKQTKISFNKFEFKVFIFIQETRISFPWYLLNRDILKTWVASKSSMTTFLTTLQCHGLEIKKSFCISIQIQHLSTHSHELTRKKNLLTQNLLKTFSQRCSWLSTSTFLLWVYLHWFDLKSVLNFIENWCYQVYAFNLSNESIKHVESFCSFFALLFPTRSLICLSVMLDYVFIHRWTMLFLSFHSFSYIKLSIHMLR